MGSDNSQFKVSLAVWLTSNWILKSRHACLFECCFTSTKTVGLLGTGAQDVHLDFHTAPELCVMNGLLWTIYVRGKVTRPCP